MTGIATSSVMAMSALTPAAMFGYVSVEKFAKKISSQIQVANAVFLSLTGNLRPFEVDLHRHTLEGQVQKHFQRQLMEPLALCFSGQNLMGRVGRDEGNIFTFHTNYNLPLISIQRVGDGWEVLQEDEEVPKELAIAFIIALEHKLFS